MCGCVHLSIRCTMTLISTLDTPCIVLIIHADRRLRSAFEISLRRFSHNASLKIYSNASKAQLLSSLSNAVRLELLSIVSEQESSVGELCSILEMSQSAVSQHLAKLRADGLMTTRRDAQTAYYSCANPGVQRVLDVLNGIFSSTLRTATYLRI